MNISEIRKLAVVLAVLLYCSALIIVDQELLANIWSGNGANRTGVTTPAAEGTSAVKGSGPADAAKVRTALSRKTASPNKAATKGPRLDLVRIAKEGASVLAGRSKPGIQILVEADGQYIGNVKADANGEWVLVTNHKFGSAEPSFRLRHMTEKDRVRLASAAAKANAARAGGKSARPETERQVSALKQLIVSARKQAKEQKQVVAAEARTAKQKAEARKPLQPDLAMGLGKRGGSPGKKLALANVPKSDADAISLPLPIGFAYRTAEFTERGQQSAKLLLEYLKVRQPSHVTLTGHADERGSHDYNKDLSRQRLATVRKFLLSGGFAGKLTLIGKGETEPYHGIDRSKFSLDALHRLDRRVELKLQ